jgi:hypothetical protein
MRQRDHHFDTLKFVKRLQGDGFTEEQSVAMMKVLNDVIEERWVTMPQKKAGADKHVAKKISSNYTQIW